MIQTDRISVSLPDNGVHEDGWTWANVTILFRDEDTGERPSVEASVHIRFDELKSISEAKKEARGNALRVLRAAVDALQAPS